MRSLLFLPILLLLLSACNTTERLVHFSDQPSGMPLAAGDVAALKDQYGDVDGVYLKYDQTLEHNVSIAFTSTIPHWEFFHIVDRQYVVYNTSSSELTSFRLEVPEQDKLEQAFITVQAPGSSDFTYDKDDLIVQTGLDGRKIYSLTYTISEPGTVIHEKYEVTRGNLERNLPAYHDIPLQYELPAQSISFKYVYPIWWQVNVKDLGLNQPLPYQRIEDSERRKILLTYTDTDVPAFAESPSGPYFKQAAPYFELQVTDLSMGSAVRYRAPEDWTVFAKEYRQYAVNRDTRLARSVSRTAENLAGPASSNLDRVEIILNYINDNVIIDESSKQRSFEIVLSRKEGNPYMVTGLMQAMLYEANIDSEYLLIHPASEGYFDPDFYSPNQFPVPALGVFVDGEQYYVLPGRQRSLSEQLPPSYRGQTAMVITDEGFGGFTEIFGDQIAQNDNLPDSRETISQEETVHVSSSGGNDDAMPAETAGTTAQEVATSTSQPAAPPEDAMPETEQPLSSVGGVVPGITEPMQEEDTQPVEEPVQDPAPPVEENVPSESEPSGPEWEGSIQTGLGGYTWIVASRTTIEEAYDLANEYIALYRAGVSVDVLQGESGGVVRYRIAIGQYTSRDLAEQDRATQLSTVLPPDAWLLRIEPSM